MQRFASRMGVVNLALAAIFADYDGTLAPLGVRREESAMPKELENELRAISERIPLAIITSKDFSFIHPRVDFASGWACVSGLEIATRDGRTLMEAPMKELTSLTPRLKKIIPETCAIELKRASGGRLLGLSVDWRFGRKPSPRTIKSLGDELSSEGYHVIHEEGHPYLDAYVGTPDKGRALLKLKELLDVGGSVMYLGDSSVDNSAFAVADVPVCVLHGQPIGNLSCEFAVRFDRLAYFLRSLRENQMIFRPDRMRRLSRSGE